MRFRVVVLALCLSGVVAGAQTLSKRGEPSHSNPAQLVRDNQIREQAEKYLAGHDEFKKVKVSVEDRVVTLKGTVEMASDRSWVADHVKRMKDVRSVNNQLVLAPPAELDEVLLARVKKALAAPHFEGVRYTVHEGLVKLSGQVRTQGDASRAYFAVMSTSGVREVESTIKAVEFN